MNKQKAPKDMTVDEFIDLVEKRYHTEDPTNMNAWINTLRMIAEEPAPNPFTPDQLATMREHQRDGYRYAAQNSAGVVCVFKNKPVKDVEYTSKITGCAFGRWIDTTAPFEVSSFEFLKNATSWDDPEPLCFADYAPLEGAALAGKGEM